jgi:hypothetical protein
MSKPHVKWGREKSTMFGTRELFVNDKSIGEFHGYVEDGSVGSISKVLEVLAKKGAINYERKLP